MAQKKLIVVLGMHRSGTSALTRGLQVLGVTLGDNLMAAVPGNNEKGFWEDLDIYHFNESLLAKVGSSWHQLGQLEIEAFSSSTYAAERDAASKLLTEKQTTTDIFAFKDPRTAILLPFWQSVFGDIGADAHYVIALRNPLEIAASLQRRDGFEMTKGLLLWAKHIINAIHYTNGKTRIFVSFGRLLDNPGHELSRIASAFDLPHRKTSDATFKEYAETYLERGLLHEVSSQPETEISDLSPAFVVRLNRLVADWAALEAGGPDYPDAVEWENIEKSFEDSAPFLRYADVVEGQRMKAVDAVNAEKHNLEMKLDAEREKTISTARDLDAEREKTISTARDLDAEREKTISTARDLTETTQKLEESQRKVSALNSVIEQNKIQAEGAARETQSLRYMQAERNKEILLAREQFEAMRQSASWRLTAPLRWAKLFLKQPISATRAAISLSVRSFWRTLPLAPSAKHAMASAVFTAFPFFFKWSMAYKTWRRTNETSKKKTNRAQCLDKIPPPDRLASLRPHAPNERKIIVAVHDLHKHGAQYLALNMARSLKTHFGYDVAIITGEDGALRKEFLLNGPVAIVSENNASETLVKLSEDGFAKAIVNSSAAGWLSHHLAHAEIHFIGLVHELPSVISSMNLTGNLKDFNQYAQRVIFPSRRVSDTDSAAFGIDWRQPTILPQGLYKRESIANPDEKEDARKSVIARLSLPDNARIVLGAGYGDYRKGVDIFARWGLALAAKAPDAHAVWIGNIDASTKPACDRSLAAAGPIAGNIHFPGFVDDTRAFYAAADIYALTSREDPFPSTALEALAGGAPVIMVAGAGGIEDLADHECVVALEDPAPEIFAKAALPLIGAQSPMRSRLGLVGRDLIFAEFGFASYMGDLVRLLGEPCPKVSVVVPNYNYAAHLERRLRSILDQTLPPWEIIFLDDASSDDSVKLAERVLSGADIRYRIVRNGRNSGSVFSQWRKGVELARGDFIWIAEADDWADPAFLQSAATTLAADEQIALSYTQSNQVDIRGSITRPDYLDYVADVDPERWQRGYRREGRDEIRRGLSVKNTIPNVSAVVFRSQPLKRILSEQIDEIMQFRVAGDWFVYVHMLRHGGVAFDSRSLNNHRRHDESVTISRFGLEEFAEIAQMQAYVAREFGTDTPTRQKARAYLDHLAREYDLVACYGAEVVAKAMVA